jgi:hypothetical protein
MRFNIDELIDLLSLDSLSVSSCDESTCSSVLQGLELLTVCFISSDEEEDDSSTESNDGPPSVVFVPVMPIVPPLRRSTRTRRAPVRFMDEYDKYYR